MPAASRPAVTADHQRAAFEAFAWTGWTFEQAMADELRSRLVKLRARQICSEQARVMRRTVVPMVQGLQQAMREARYRPGIGAQHRHATAPWPPSLQDLKRAAAGDRDD
jgi:hypothetical protein